MVVIRRELPRTNFAGPIPLAELQSNVVSLAKAMRTLKVPTVITTTARDSMWGPTFPELVSALPDAKIIDRSSVNAWDDPKVAAARVKPLSSFQSSALWRLALAIMPR